MKTDSVNRWLTLGANVGILIGIILLLVELDQNSTMMRAQIWNERTSQGIDVYMSAAESQDLSDIDVLLRESGFPDDSSSVSELTPRQNRQYYWYLQAERHRIENALYQQMLGLIDLDEPAPLRAGQAQLQRLEAFGMEPRTERLRRFILEVEKMHD